MDAMIKGMISDLCGEDLFADIWNTLNVNLFASEELGMQVATGYGTVLSIVEQLYTSVVQPVAIYLMFIYFIIALVDKMTSENFTWEQLGRQFCLFLGSFFLINHGLQILELFFGMGISFATDVHTLLEATLDDPDSKYAVVETAIETFRETIDVWDWLKDILLFVYLLIPWAFAWVMGLIVKIICYTRVIEIYARATFAPIALSDFFQNGFQGAGWRFLKSFLAVCFQGAMILVISMIYSALFTVATASVTPGNISISDPEAFSFFKFIGTILSFMAATCMLMFKSLSLSKEILGVN